MFEVGIALGWDSLPVIAWPYGCVLRSHRGFDRDVDFVIGDWLASDLLAPAMLFAVSVVGTALKKPGRIVKGRLRTEPLSLVRKEARRMRWRVRGEKMAAQPIEKIRAGQVSCAIWENEVEVGGRQVKMLKATVERRYTDKTGAWRSSGSFSRNEIPQAVFCLIKAYAMMMEQGAAREDDDAAQ